MIDLLQSPLFWTVLSAVGMPVFFWLGLRRLKVVRTIIDTPTSRVRSAAQGYVEISGIARTFEGKLNFAPLTRLPSVWWYFCIEIDEGSGNRRGWKTVQSGTSDDNFLLHDDSGHCVVDPDGAEVFPSIRKVWYGSQDWPAPELGTSNPLLGAFQRYRYTEHRIPHEGSLNAIGEFRSLGSALGDSLEDDVAELLRQWKADQPELLRRFDTNRDGIISATEWEQARQAARDQILRNQVVAPPQPTLNMLSKPRDDRPFLIAGVDLDKIARRAKLQTIAAWFGFVASAGLFTWLVTHY